MNMYKKARFYERLRMNKKYIRGQYVGIDNDEKCVSLPMYLCLASYGDSLRAMVCHCCCTSSNHSLEEHTLEQPPRGMISAISLLWM